MKRLMLLCLITLLLLCSCTGSNPDFQPVAYPDSVRQYSDFACVAYVGAEEICLTGDAAVQLYEKSCEACAYSETVISAEMTGEAVTLIFYTGGADTASDLTPYLQPDAVSYGQFVIRDNDMVRYSDHVLVSHGTTFKLKEGTYAELCALIEQLAEDKGTVTSLS
ncbi:MAG: hypothetical protein IJW00_02650 [Clostridia bacterium]|nr:hypothetical protein [Clostridia bacterium]